VKSSITYVLLIILFASSQLCFGQDKSEAVLFDSFNKVVPEEMAARLESFITELRSEPNSQGYVLIYPEKDSIKQNFRLERRYEKFIKEIISLVRFDKNRILIVRSKEAETVKVEFWKVPPGIDKPFSVEDKWSETLPDLTKPFIFGFTHPEEIFPNFTPEFYADYLKNNENLRGHIVVFNNFNNSREDANKWIKVLTEEYKVPRNRLKVFFGKTNGSIIYLGKGLLPVEAEFWLVPKKRNKKYTLFTTNP
jgi:hypothetical protein